jgi:hypothetical protein
MLWDLEDAEYRNFQGYSKGLLAMAVPEGMPSAWLLAFPSFPAMSIFDWMYNKAGEISFPK